MTNNLLNTNDTKKAIQIELKKAKSRIVILSAFVSNTLDWIESNITNNLDKTLIIRGRLSDFQQGATRIEDLETAIKNDWTLGFLDSLHAKVFIFDDSRMILGSSNMTQKGLALYGAGNLEFSNRLIASKEDLAVISKIIRTAKSPTLNDLILMKSILKKNNSIDQWPVEKLILAAPLVVGDMLWQSPFSQNPDSTLREHDINILRIDEISVRKVRESLTSTKVFKWLYQKIKESEDSELYYGYITKMLHSELSEELPIYRTRVKESLSILFDYIRYSDLSYIKIDQPRHSQRIRFLSN